MTRNLNGYDLPEAGITKGMDPLLDYIDGTKLPPEALIELIVYARRQTAAVAEEFGKLETLAKAKLDAIYAETVVDKRETRKAGAGQAVYSPPGEKVTIRDRDETVESLTDEQIRISYKPDVKALTTILKKDHLERLVVRTPTPDKVVIKDTGGDYEEF